MKLEGVKLRKTGGRQRQAAGQILCDKQNNFV